MDLKRRGDNDNDSENEPPSKKEKTPEKPVRKRKKRIYKDLLSQLEFYFSDANLVKSKYMRELLDKTPKVNLDTFKKFNKLAKMCKDLFDDKQESQESQRDFLQPLEKALMTLPSELLLYCPKSKTVTRKHSPRMKETKTEEDSTIYVENISISSSTDSLKAIFEPYGKVVYISLPKYKHNKQNKGFAFVEFESPSGVQRALESLGSFENSKPNELQSVKAFVIQQKEEEKNENQKDKQEKKDKKEEKRLSSRSLVLDSPLELRIMSKTTWRRLRNKYLNDQRKSLSHLKSEYRASRRQTLIETDSSSLVSFTPGVIVKFENETPISEVKIFKQKINAALTEPVSYIDISLGETEYHVRCVNSEQAIKLSALPNGRLLNGDEESEYWSKISRCRKEKKEGKSKQDNNNKYGTHRNIRGKEKIMLKIEKEAAKKKSNHIFFPSDE